MYWQAVIELCAGFSVSRLCFIPIEEKEVSLIKMLKRACQKTVQLHRQIVLLSVLAISACGGGANPLSPPPMDTDNIISENCTADHPFVGRVRQLSSLAHGVSGEVVVLDDCTLEVTNFSYDGRGPSVYFYGGQGEVYIGEDAFSIGPRLNGRPWQNETVTLAIPAGKTLDDFDSLSVWCFEVNANFGDVYFGDI